MVADCDEAQAARFLQEQIGGISIIKRLDLGMQAIPVDEQTGLSCNIPEDWAACNFHDGLRPMGAVAISSVLRFRAARDITHLAALLGEDELAATYHAHAQRIAESVQQLLLMPSGWIMAASEVNRQPDVWATSYAVYEGLLTGQEGRAAAEAMLEAYRQGTVSAFGYLRHTPTTADAVPGKHTWEHLDSVGQGAYGTYQNGGYWPQPVGFYAFAIAQIDRQAAAQLAREFIDHTRLLAEQGAPYEWLSRSFTLEQTPGLCRWLGASAALPLEGFRRLSTEYDAGQSPP